MMKKKQLGMEDTPEEFTENLVKVFREVKRVLRDDGTVWLNLGDFIFKRWKNYNNQSIVAW
jgi:calcineurin-like phosphoesterase family protein